MWPASQKELPTPDLDHRSSLLKIVIVFIAKYVFHRWHVGSVPHCTLHASDGSFCLESVRHRVLRFGKDAHGRVWCSIASRYLTIVLHRGVFEPFEDKLVAQKPYMLKSHFYLSTSGRSILSEESFGYTLRDAFHTSASTFFFAFIHIILFCLVTTPYQIK